ncbi:MAG: cation:proton antiporter [Bacteroidota bacterium]|jgi:Kef-type K+ transport system membrane component KefB|nr:cation:proton antiporter [Bacteroidota bacterium]HHU95876.1 cation:proton antiporter [Petrimonas sp.]
MLLTVDFTLPLTNPTLQFLILFVIILTAPILFNKIKVPSLIGLIIAGAVIGSYGLGLMTRDSNMIMLGNAGLLYIMFLAGVEIDLAEFKKSSAKSLVFGLISFLTPMLFSYLAGHYLLGMTVMSSVLFASMISSHTLLTYPLISKMGVGKNRAVTVAVGGTVITDTLALLVLAVIVSMNEGGIGFAFWTKLTISILLFALIVIVGFPLFTRWFFKHFPDSTTQFIFVLTMIFLGGLLAELAGIEGIIGAFLAGLSMNRLLPRVSPLMNRVDFVGNAIFIPIFLISVGMLIDYRVFFGDLETLKVSVVMTVVAILSKFLAALFTQKIFRYTNAERMLIFGLSNSQAAATLATVMVGHRVGLLDDAILNGAVVMILITCTVSSLRAQKGAIATSLLEGTTGEAEGESVLDERILIPVANKDTLKDLIEFSLVIKSKENTRDLYALNIIRSSEATPEAEKNSEKLLEEAAMLGAGAETIIQPLKRYDMNILNGILGVVKKYVITDIVMGLHIKQEISESFLGNLVEGVLDKSRTTLYVYKAMQPLSTVKRRLVVVPRDADKEIGFALWISKLWNLGRNTGAKLSFYADEAMLDILRQIQRIHPVDGDFHLFEDWNEFPSLAKEVGKDEALFIVMSRDRKASYHPVMQRIPDYINHYFREKNFMLLYPLQSTTAEGYHSQISIPLLSSNQVLGGVSDVLAAVVREKEEREGKVDKEAEGEDV